MIWLYAFLFSGFVCLIGQILYDFTKLTPGHITSIFVLAGVALYSFGIYEWLVRMCGGGAMVPITNFGYILAKGSVEGAREGGFLGMLKGLLAPASAVISLLVVISGLGALITRPHK